ncbi:MAG TPA: SRPBCC domain-containing protein [Polyangiaceae bacterium]|jgi:uncharacterized protein YndB with AHSA1/START domain|nr:SRPBCC domain-containing protein [Polyangiaceae bacterium]
MTSKAQARAIADVEKGIVLATVDIAVPPERVFKALTTDELTQWWGSAELYRTTKHDIDLRVGGKWRSEGVGNDGTPFHVGGEVLEVEAPSKLVYTWKPSWDNAEPSIVAYRFEAIAEGTRLTVRHSGFQNPNTCADHANGWERVLSWLTGNFASATPARYFLVRLIAPRPTFMQDMNDEERQMMMAHGQYWKQKLAEGSVIAFGPVMDPKGGWGVGIVKAQDEAEVRVFEAADPAISSGRGLYYEVLPMMAAVY